MQTAKSWFRKLRRYRLSRAARFRQQKVQAVPLVLTLPVTTVAWTVGHVLQCGRVNAGSARAAGLRSPVDLSSIRR